MINEQHQLRNCNNCKYEYIDAEQFPCNRCGLMYRYYEEKDRQTEGS